MIQARRPEGTPASPSLRSMRSCPNSAFLSVSGRITHIRRAARNDSTRGRVLLRRLRRAAVPARARDDRDGAARSMRTVSRR